MVNWFSAEPNSQTLIRARKLWSAATKIIHAPLSKVVNLRKTENPVRKMAHKMM